MQMNDNCEQKKKRYIADKAMWVELNVSVMDDMKRFMGALPSCFMPLQQNFRDYKLSLNFLWHLFISYTLNRQFFEEAEKFKLEH